MKAKKNPIVFNAKWHQSIFAYRKKRSFAKWAALSIFFPVPIVLRLLRKICRRRILPSSSYSKREVKTISEIFHTNWFSENRDQNPLIDYYDATPLRLITPDGISLFGVYFRNRRATEDTQTTIFFQPNASLTIHAEYEWLLEKAAQENRIGNFITFDYRGCGESGGKARDMRSLLLDGDTVFQFAKEYLKVPDPSLLLYGYSLGGGVSALVRSLYPEKEIRYINERSFSSLSSVICALYPQKGRYLAFLAKKLHWEITVSKIYPKIKGEKLLIYQPDDEVIPFKASLFHNLKEKSSISILELHLEQKIQIDFHHSAPLDQYVDRETMRCAQKTVLDFLFSPQKRQVISSCEPPVK